jgi:hypothetical protein
MNSYLELILLYIKYKKSTKIGNPNAQIARNHNGYGFGLA